MHAQLRWCSCGFTGEPKGDIIAAAPDKHRPIPDRSYCVFEKEQSPHLPLCQHTPAPLFQFQDGSTLQRKAALQGSPDTASMRRGPIGSYWAQVQDSAATAAARSGLEDSFVQTLGR